jgi:hypothetical protein
MVFQRRSYCHNVSFLTDDHYYSLRSRWRNWSPTCNSTAILSHTGKYGMIICGVARASSTHGGEQVHIARLLRSRVPHTSSIKASRANLLDNAAPGAARPSDLCDSACIRSGRMGVLEIAALAEILCDGIDVDASQITF